MSAVLITGADSFIGANFLKFSKFSGAKEISLIENNADDIDFTGYEVVLHLAAIVHQSKRIHRDIYFRINRDLSLRLAQGAKKAGVKQFIFMSTVKVYGKYNPDAAPWNEFSLCYPEDDYGLSKFEAEQALLRLQNPDFTVSVVRTPVVYGDGVKANILKLIKLVELFKILPFKNVRNSRHFTYAGNLVAFIDRIIEKRIPGIFIVMDDGSLSTTLLVKLIAEALERKILLINIPPFLLRIAGLYFPRLVESLYESIAIDNSVTKELLDFVPPYTSKQGICFMIAAYRNRKVSGTLN